MQIKKLGRSDLHVSTMAFGCMSLGNDHDNNRKLLHEAIALGVNFFDTADLYQKGFNEESVGMAVKGIRDKIILATKVGNQWRADGSGWDWNPTKKYILASVEQSLKRLQTEYIDLYQLHGGTIEDPIDETIEAFELLQQQGKIRCYGISCIRPNVIREYVKRSKIVSVMMQYSLLDRRPEEECVNLLHGNNIGILARGVLASGLLIDKPSKPYLNYTDTEVKKVAGAIDQIEGRSKTETAVQFVLQHKTSVFPVVGIRNPEQLHAAVKAIEAPPLSAPELLALKSAVPVNHYELHR